ncbi:Zinc finger CCHC-type and RNA-binding motif-containing protein 1 [Halocaridina rubra]|uniref:Zinc finger CCHC-type and RNA-binding motif-containing protein 1 n=1 Tax=Halocaridina rubra TaxID=373956 RepID=A0AAN9ABN8_HALRR
MSTKRISSLSTPKLAKREREAFDLDVKMTMNRCYECGEIGHLSYSCPKNLLGNREPPKKKMRKKKRDGNVYSQSEIDEAESEDDENGSFDDESLSAAIRYQQELREAEDFQRRVNAGDYSVPRPNVHKSKITQSSYFSDEEEENEGANT